MKSIRKIIQIDEEKCDGCGQCVMSCAEGAIEIIDGKARLVSETYCDGLGACLGECPRDALHIIEREADEFDPEAVEQYLEEKEKHEREAPKPLGELPLMPPPMACGCPSSQIRVFEPAGQRADRPAADHGDSPSALTHWPVQIRLVPPNAPFLKGADLLIAADCTPVAYPNFHRDFVKGRVVLLGCPKFDDSKEYIKKFADIFRQAGIRSITVVDMEVPCCSALPAIVKKGMEAAGKQVALEEVVIGVRGEVISRTRQAAA